MAMKFSTILFKLDSNLLVDKFGFVSVNANICMLLNDLNHKNGGLFSINCRIVVKNNF